MLGYVPHEVAALVAPVGAVGAGEGLLSCMLPHVVLVVGLVACLVGAVSAEVHGVLPLLLRCCCSVVAESEELAAGVLRARGVALEPGSIFYLQ